MNLIISLLGSQHENLFKERFSFYKHSEKAQDFFIIKKKKILFY